jgi:hypothetical protein
LEAEKLDLFKTLEVQKIKNDTLELQGMKDRKEVEQLKTLMAETMAENKQLLMVIKEERDKCHDLGDSLKK